MTAKEYGVLVKEKSPPTPLVKNMTMAFVVGGLICLLGQGVTNFLQSRGLSEEMTAMATPVTLVFLGALLTALRVFDNLAQVAGAGTLIPITGFANAVVSPAMEFRSEGLVMGLGAGMFKIAGPVLVFGIAASVLYGVVLLLI